MVIQRALAELVDIVINIFLLVINVKYILPIFGGLVNVPLLYMILSTAMYIALIILIQGIFWTNGESIGKYFMRLEIVPKDENDEITLEMMIAREFFIKYISFYFSSLPLFLRKESIQEKATNTIVRRKNVGTKV